MQEIAFSRVPAEPATATDQLLRVLLVEDDPEYARMVERVLQRARPPLRVHREERLDAALEQLERDRYDALVVDLSLPDGVGRSILSGACAVASRLPVLVLTGTDDAALAIDAIRAGAEDFLVKQRTHALALPGAVMHAIERHRRTSVRSMNAPQAAKPALAGEVLLLDRLERALARAHRRGEQLAVLVAGYDDLGWLAEALDSTTVEKLVSHAAERLALGVRRSDTLARLDAYRFALVVEGCAERAHLEGIAQSVRKTLQHLETEPVRGVEVAGLIARVGISVYPDEGGDAETLLENATAAWELLPPRGGISFYALQPSD